ncbi:hypothetical protein HHI36_018796 [Cryptolaemus montrouzieri]|uniref:Uncharacterized protein n=1 Tax=Cryptolaemus montrouzieri TaxID=559131 RepID=A0ABD2P155_9CUCU
MKTRTVRIESSQELEKDIADSRIKGKSGNSSTSQHQRTTSTEETNEEEIPKDIEITEGTNQQKERISKEHVPRAVIKMVQLNRDVKETNASALEEQFIINASNGDAEFSLNVETRR